jgi:hypothetical protein
VLTRCLLKVFTGKQLIVVFKLDAMVVINTVVDLMHSSVMVWLLFPLARPHECLLQFLSWIVSSVSGPAPTLGWICFELLMLTTACIFLWNDYSAIPHDWFEHVELQQKIIVNLFITAASLVIFLF